LVCAGECLYVHVFLCVHACGACFVCCGRSFRALLLTCFSMTFWRRQWLNVKAALRTRVFTLHLSCGRHKVLEARTLRCTPNKHTCLLLSTSLRTSGLGIISMCALSAIIHKFGWLISLCVTGGSIFSWFNLLHARSSEVAHACTHTQTHTHIRKHIHTHA